MFSHKAPKSESTSHLLKLLTHRSQQKRLSVRRGIYDEWPTYEKPSLLNYSAGYLKYLAMSEKGKQDEKQNDNEGQKGRSKKSTPVKKAPATFSTCTTMEFFPATHQNLFLGCNQTLPGTQAVSKFVSTRESFSNNTPASDFNDAKRINPTVHQNNLHPLTNQNNFISCMQTPQEHESQSLMNVEQQNFDTHIILNSAVNQQNDESFLQGMNSKYHTIQQTNKERPKTYSHQRKKSQERRLVQTAKIDRKELQVVELQMLPDPVQLLRKQSSSRSGLTSNSRPTTAKTFVSSSNQLNTLPSSKQFTRATHTPLPQSRSPTHTPDPNVQLTYNPPMRLKDYETNFQAFKVISQLIDCQMKWQPKRKRPKSSVMFRKYESRNRA